MSGVPINFALASELVKKHREIDRLKGEIKDLKAVIRRHCKEFWAFRGQDPAQCRICALREFKDEHKKGEEG